MVLESSNTEIDFIRSKIDPAIRISVHLITYNHENYIRRAIEGVLVQKVNFTYELLIGDDCSTDNTREIIKEYHNKYPEIIKPLLHPYNLGPKGLEGKNNFLTTLYACKGKYIALCDGDDYWIDPFKLQKQVDFLEANEDYAICFHRVYELAPGKGPELSNLNTSVNQETYTIEDLAKGNFIHTPSVVFRNGLIPKLPTWFMDAPAGDYVLHMLNAEHGKIKYFPDPMAVYRRHSGGVWSSVDYRTNLIKFNWIKKKLDTHFNYKYHNLLFNDEYKIEILKSDLEYYKHSNSFFSYIFSVIKLARLKKKTHYSLGYHLLLFKRFFAT